MAPVNSLSKWHIALSLIIALILQAVPYPQFLALFKPEWVLLVVIYWSMYAPERFGFILAWLTGLLQDILIGVYMGQHAIIYTILTYCLLTSHLRIRIFPFWKQSLIAFFCILLAKFIMISEYMLVNQSIIIPNPSGSIIVTGILWYVVFYLINSLLKIAANPPKIL